MWCYFVEVDVLLMCCQCAAALCVIYVRSRHVPPYLIMDLKSNTSHVKSRAWYSSVGMTAS
jgi:hypothetical protein